MVVPSGKGSKANKNKKNNKAKKNKGAPTAGIDRRRLAEDRERALARQERTNPYVKSTDISSSVFFLFQKQQRRGR